MVEPRDYESTASPRMHRESYGIDLAQYVGRFFNVDTVGHVAPDHAPDSLCKRGTLNYRMLAVVCDLAIKVSIARRQKPPVRASRGVGYVVD